jgi:FG-GAP repeat
MCDARHHFGLAAAIAAVLALALASATSAQVPVSQQAELKLSDGAPGDLFVAVAIDSDTLVVGAPGRDVGGNKDQGVVFVYERPASGWANATPVARLTASDGVAGDGLGSAVAIDGDTIVAGAGNRKVGDDAFQGAIYVFEKPASGWRDATQVAELTADDGNPGDGLATSLAISGDTIVAGPAQHQVGNNFRQGQAYAFLKAPSGWANATQTLLRASDGAADDGLGISVGISGDLIAVGAPHKKVGDNEEQGAVYIYGKPEPGDFQRLQSAQLTATDGAANDELGLAVAVSGDTVVAGAPNHQVGLSRQGAAYVFVEPFNLNPTQTAELTASDGVTNDLFGRAVAIDRDKVVASAFRRQVGANPFQGAAYLYQRRGFIWANATETAQLLASDGAAGDAFGITLGVSGNVAAIGGGLHLAGGTIGPGAVYLFGPSPEIAIGAPADGATYPRGGTVTAQYSCTAPAPAAITACAGSVADGARVDTSALGPNSFSVEASDSDGFSATRTVSYTVVSGKPSITALRQSASVWRRGRRLARITSARRRPVGTTFSFRLSEPASLTFSFSRRAAGSKRKRAALAGRLRLGGHQGLNQVRFQGRLTRTKRLRPGGYALRITATGAGGQRTTSRPLRFRIVSG